EAAKWYRKSTPKNSEKEGMEDNTDIIWLRKAALNGHARAQNRPAEIYEHGNGVPPSLKESSKWYGRAAHQGDDLAQFNLARLLEASGATQEALDWFHKAGKQGHLLAQAELGKHYKSSADDIQAFKWFRLAAEQGQNSAQYHLGLMYHNGRGIPVDFQEAILWFRRSAEQDYLPAIGALYKLEHSLEV
ncbi:MAG: sel1 repeat family protein, partial [Nitrospina sp.]|nr:sel1 repeat family protein [Nitrospina sp.]